jgi:hypothetical protein
MNKSYCRWGTSSNGTFDSYICSSSDSVILATPRGGLPTHHGIGTNARVMSLTGAALVDRLQIVGSESAGNRETPTSIAPGQRAVVCIEFDCVRDQVPPVLDHEIEYSVGSDPTAFLVNGGRTAVESMALQELGPPVGRGIWVAVHHPDWKRGHRRVVYTLYGRAQIPGRFAIDWIQVDEQGHKAMPAKGGRIPRSPVAYCRGMT